MINFLHLWERTLSEFMAECLSISSKQKIKGKERWRNRITFTSHPHPTIHSQSLIKIGPFDINLTYPN